MAAQQKVIALDSTDTLRDRLGASEWVMVEKLKVIGCLGPRDQELIRGLSFYSLKSIDLKDCTCSDFFVDFIGNDVLQDIILPNDLQALPPNIFCGCTALQSVILPDGLDTIGECAFKDSLLPSLVIPSRVTLIMDNAFAGCTRLQNIISNPTDAPFVRDGALSGLSDGCIVTVPKGSLDFYLANKFWSRLKISEAGDPLSPTQNDAQIDADASVLSD